MRDNRRIPILMERLQKYWMNNPDLRLGQMMLIAGKRLGFDDIWNIEDGELIDALIKRENAE